MSYTPGRASKVRLKCWAGPRVLLDGHGYSKEIFAIRVTNVGERPVVLENIKWRTGKRRKAQPAVLLSNHPLSAQCPKTLGYGETTEFIIPFKLEDESDFLAHFAKLVGPRQGRPARSLRIRIFTSVGRVTTLKPEKDFLDRLERFAESANGNKAKNLGSAATDL